MKALSLWQPWASAIAAGAKRIETRHWATRYRGPLAIHAAKRKNVAELMHYHACWNWIGAMRPLGWGWGKHNYDIDRLPFGAIVAVCDLVDCRPTDSFTQAELDTPRRPVHAVTDAWDWTERQMGNFDLGRFGWVLDNVRALPEPIPCKGRQGLFAVDLEGVRL
jgi:hypothetical protein